MGATVSTNIEMLLAATETTHRTTTATSINKVIPPSMADGCLSTRMMMMMPTSAPSRTHHPPSSWEFFIGELLSVTQHPITIKGDLDLDRADILGGAIVVKSQNNKSGLSKESLFMWPVADVAVSVCHIIKCLQK